MRPKLQEYAGKLYTPVHYFAGCEGCANKVKLSSNLWTNCIVVGGPNMIQVRGLNKERGS